MIRSLKQLYGIQLGATDGQLGAVKDFYFDDRRWAVRYVVADTGSWLSGRQVLLSPHALGNIYQPGKLLLVNLTRQQIQKSPGLQTHQPVSRQFEESYYEYYGWPNYWVGDGLWGTTGFPTVVNPFPRKEPAAIEGGPHPNSAAAHLRSTQAVAGYQIRSTDGVTGHVTDFLMDDKSWTIQQLVIQTGHRLTGREIQIPTTMVERISYEDSTVFVNLTEAELSGLPNYHREALGAAA
jgi:uncharacterized protein YrrD